MQWCNAGRWCKLSGSWAKKHCCVSFSKMFSDNQFKAPRNLGHTFKWKDLIPNKDLAQKLKEKNEQVNISSGKMQHSPQNYLDSGYLVSVAKLLVYMCPPTSIWTGALDFVSCAGVGMPWLFKGDAGDLVIRGLDILGRLSCKKTQSMLGIWSILGKLTII